jgi:hypothetical protein
MSNLVVASYFETRLNTWAAAQSPVIPVAWEGQGFAKPASDLWLEPFLIPNETMNYEVSGVRKTHLGLFHVNCWGKTGEGMGKVRRLAQSVVDLFPLVPKVGLVSIESTPTASRPIESDPSGWVGIPVLIKYRYEAT